MPTASIDATLDAANSACDVSLPGSHPRTRALWPLLGVPVVALLSSSASAQTEEASPSPSEPGQVSEVDAPTGVQTDASPAPKEATQTEEVPPSPSEPEQGSEVEAPTGVRTDSSPAPTEATLMEGEPPPPAEPERTPHVSVGGWIEGYYGWNFNRPSNGITDLRGFDNRHNSVNLSNAVLDVAFERQGVHADLTLQWGTTPATYYLGEPAAPALGTGVGAQDAALWRVLQEANFGYRVPIGAGLDVSAGLSPHPRLILTQRKSPAAEMRDRFRPALDDRQQINLGRGMSGRGMSGHVTRRSARASGAALVGMRRTTDVYPQQDSRWPMMTS